MPSGGKPGIWSNIVIGEPMKGFNQGFDIHLLNARLPAELDAAILKVLSSHVGRDAAVSRKDLVRELAVIGHVYANDRPVRAAINLLRKAGAPICSTGGREGGYFLASSWEELDEYLKREVHARAMDLLEQESAMRSQAVRQWGAVRQLSLL
jgi:hypothetical protein